MHRRILVPTIAVVSAFGPLNSATVLVALPALAAGLHVSPGAATLVVSVYLVATTVLVPFAGPFADAVGRRRVVLVALLALGATSLLAASATGIAQLVVARLLQALCTALTIPAGMALVREHVIAARRSRAFGTVAATTNAAGVIAPLVGALMIQLAGWRAVFLVNVPLALVVAAVAARVLPDEPQRPAGGSWLPRFELFGRHDLAVSASSAFLHTLALYSVLIVLPFAFAGHRPGAFADGMGPAMLLVTLTGGLVVGGPIGGRAAARYGRRRVAAVSLATAAAALVVAGLHPPLALLPVPLALAGFGLGAGLPPLQASAVDAVDRQDAAAAGSLFMVGRNAGALTGTLALGGVFGRATAASVYTPAMLVLAASALGAALLATRLDGGPVPPQVVMLPEPAGGEVT